MIAADARAEMEPFTHLMIDIALDSLRNAASTSDCKNSGKSIGCSDAYSSSHVSGIFLEPSLRVSMKLCLNFINK